MQAINGQTRVVRVTLVTGEDEGVLVVSDRTLDGNGIYTIDDGTLVVLVIAVRNRRDVYAGSAFTEHAHRR